MGLEFCVFFGWLYFILYALWLVKKKKTCATSSTKQKENQNQSWLACMYFRALDASYMVLYLFWVLICLLCSLCLLLVVSESNFSLPGKNPIQDLTRCLVSCKIQLHSTCIQISYGSMRENLESHGIFFILQASVKALKPWKMKFRCTKHYPAFFFVLFFCLFVCFLVDAELRREDQRVTQWNLSRQFWERSWEFLELFSSWRVWSL